MDDVFISVRSYTNKQERLHICRLSTKRAKYQKKMNKREIVFTPEILAMSQTEAAKVLKIGTSTCVRLYEKALNSIPELAAILAQRAPGANVWPSRSINKCPFFEYASKHNGIKYLKRIYNSTSKSGTTF